MDRKAKHVSTSTTGAQGNGAGEVFRDDLRKWIKRECNDTQAAIARAMGLADSRLSTRISRDELTEENFGPVIDTVLARLADRSRELPPGTDPARATKQYWMDALARAAGTTGPGPASPTDPDPAPTPPAQPDRVHIPEAKPTNRRSPKVVLAVGGTALACVGVGIIIWGATQMGGGRENNGQGAGGPTSSSASQAPSTPAQPPNTVESPQAPFIDISGTCTRQGDQLAVKSSGFKGSYTVAFFGPDKKPYALDLGTQGTANPDGTVKTKWTCEHKDAPGLYSVEITDHTTGIVAKDTFQVDAV